jgi:hypothetical protein
MMCIVRFFIAKRLIEPTLATMAVEEGSTGTGTSMNTTKVENGA